MFENKRKLISRSGPESLITRLTWIEFMSSKRLLIDFNC